MDLPRTPTFDLTGKKALVAGASSGIGLAGAVALAEAGAELVLAARRADLLAELAAALADHGWKASILPLDVADIPSIQAAVAEHGPFDILLNSAGLARHSPASNTTEADFDAVSDINIKAAYFLAQAVAKGLIAAGKPGSLITISSQMAKVGGIDRAVYAATKHAVEGFTKSMAIEWGAHGIRVNTICPTLFSPISPALPLISQTSGPGLNQRSNSAGWDRLRILWARCSFSVRCRRFDNRISPDDRWGWTAE